MNLALLTNGTRARQGRSSRPGRNGLIHSSTNSALAPQNTSLDAAALQAHFTRSLNLSLGTKDFTRSRRARPSQNRNNRQNNQPSGRPGFERTGRRRRGDDSSGSISSSSNIPATTLAQKRGLVQGPKMLSEEEWKEKLTPEQYQVCRCSATEPPFQNNYFITTYFGNTHVLDI